MANEIGKFTSIEVENSAKLGGNKLYFANSEGVILNNTTPYAKISWDNGNGQASYNKGSILFKYENGVLVLARTDNNISILKDNNELIYLEKNPNVESFTLKLDSVSINQASPEDVGPTIQPMAKPELELIDLCPYNTIYNNKNIKVNKVKSELNTSENVSATNVNGSQFDVNTINVRDKMTIENTGLLNVESGLVKLNNTITLPNINDGFEIQFNINSGIIIGSIFDENKTFADFTIIKNTTKNISEKSNIIVSFSQSELNNISKIKENSKGIALVSNLNGKKMSFGIMYDEIKDNNQKPSVVINSISPDSLNNIVYNISNLQHTVILGDPNECGIEVVGEAKVNKITTGESGLSVEGKTTFNKGIVTNATGNSTVEWIDF